MKIDFKRQTGIPKRCEVPGCQRRAEWTFVANGKCFAICTECALSIKNALKSLKPSKEENSENAEK